MMGPKAGELLIRNAPKLLSRSQLDLVATTILLLEEVSPDARLQVLTGIEEKKMRVVPAVVSQLYEACPPDSRPDFAMSLAVSCLPPKWFNPIFRDAYGRAMNPEQRGLLHWSLGDFLRRHHAEVPRYRTLILQWIRSRSHNVCLSSLPLAGEIDDLGSEDLAVLRKKLFARPPEMRLNGLNAFSRLFWRFRQLSPEVREFCCSSELYAQIRELRRNDEDPLVRWGGRNCLLARRASLSKRGGRPPPMRRGTSLSDIVPREFMRDLKPYVRKSGG